MNDTESTAIITLTGHDRHRILDDLWAVTGLGDHIEWLVVDNRADYQSNLYLDREAHVAPMAIVHGLLDDARAWTSKPIGGKTAGSANVYVTGYYRGVPIMASFTEKFDDQDAAEAALADLLAAIGGAQS
jgi:hypothetical protein